MFDFEAEVRLHRVRVAHIAVQGDLDTLQSTCYIECSERLGDLIHRRRLVVSRIDFKGTGRKAERAHKARWVLGNHVSEVESDDFV